MPESLRTDQTGLPPPVKPSERKLSGPNGMMSMAFAISIWWCQCAMV